MTSAGSSSSTTADTAETMVASSSGEAPASSSGTVDSTTSTTSGGSSGAASSSGGGSTTTGEELGPFTACYDGVFVNNFPGPNYDGYDMPIGSHCLGTNQQEIDDIERVVFLGDSVTVGTPPTATEDFYRSKLADSLADRFGLQFGANKGLWQLANVLEGTSVARDSGDFSSCAKWGARNDDLLGGNQFTDCFPEDVRDQKTLTIITSGGNDLAKLAREAQEGATDEEVWAIATSAIDEKRASIEWLTSTENFPNGNHVVFGNVYEFTDGTGDVGSCDFAGLAGFDGGAPLNATSLIIVAWMQDQYAQIALETGADFIFMFEEFCGHGFNSDNPEAACYRGPGNANWFDITCIHPTPTGHAVLADMFFETIAE